jgi:hypothetical protein
LRLGREDSSETKTLKLIEVQLGLSTHNSGGASLQSIDCGPARGSDRREFKFFDRSHDVYENKGQVEAGLDCSHDVDENKRVD